jgi:hypothetical protein
MKLPNWFRVDFPFSKESKTSWVALILLWIIFRIFDGFITRIGGLITENSKVIIPHIKKLLSLSFSINLRLWHLALLIMLLPLYYLIDKLLLKKLKREVIFKETFTSIKIGWHLNYWGTSNPKKTNRIENSMMIFEAEESELTHESKCFGAYYDLRTSIYDGYKYEVSCKVFAGPNTTMGFQLWLHDTRGNNEVFMPIKQEAPSTSIQTITAIYTANDSGGIRIHLHNKGGKGNIYIKEITVTKI